MTLTDDKAKDAIQQGVDAVDDAILTVAEKASNVTKKACGVAIHTMDDGRDAYEKALACSKDAIRSNPIAAVALVAAIAYLCGRLKR